MKINKLFNSVNDVMSDVFDGAVIMLGGFGEAGSPVELIHGLIDTKCKNLNDSLALVSPARNKSLLAFIFGVIT